MNYFIKEIEKKDVYDFMYVNTMSWTETYKGIIDDSFLEKIVKEIDKNAERQVNLFDKFKNEEPILSVIFFMSTMNQLELWV